MLVTSQYLIVSTLYSLLKDVPMSLLGPDPREGPLSRTGTPDPDLRFGVVAHK